MDADVSLAEPSFEIDALVSRVLAAAVEVHRVLGPGFFETVYARALERELELRRVPFARQPTIGIVYEGQPVGVTRPDLLVAERLIVELETVERVESIHVAQGISYLKAAHLQLALVINFNVPVLLRGVRRVVLSPKSKV